MDPSSPMKRSSRNLGDGDLDGEADEGMPLPEGTLTSNLGLDIVVVVTKVNPGWSLPISISGINYWVILEDFGCNIECDYTVYG